MDILDRVEARKAEILSRVPETAHQACKQEARYQQNAHGGRYTDHLTEAVANYLDGYPFGSPTARGMLSIDGSPLPGDAELVVECDRGSRVKISAAKDGTGHGIFLESDGCDPCFVTATELLRILQGHSRITCGAR